MFCQAVWICLSTPDSLGPLSGAQALLLRQQCRHSLFGENAANLDGSSPTVILESVWIFSISISIACVCFYLLRGVTFRLCLFAAPGGLTLF